ncbi:MAG: valine--tRNA ligase [Anaerolineae bacterium]|nr:valine--tRNA ligase [Candidatus Roseilinea sp.]MDW8449763.1 valine--tRNA ligase [Anaerolineae bacterium]
MTELSKTYDPKAVERRIYDWWEKHGYFKPENQIYLDPNQPQFVITIPPPNVTGTLHMGHALTSAIEDVMTRYHRMKGARTLWVPGTDHAGIATQAVVEKKLEQEGRRRRDMTRDEFLAEVWAWKEHSQRIINNQQRAMGISVDWDREAFTLDEERTLAVRTAFKRLYDKGLIYRDTRMVNWDPVQLTGVSDLEVEVEEEGEPGFLYYVRYPLQTNRWEGPQHPWGSGRWAEGATEWITVATTRPETILGDTAVMVNPEDDRYTHRVACRAILPAIGREIPIISDSAVDMTFGTGAVKVTPAHDFVDYEVGKRHHLPFVEVMDETAKMNANAGPYAGLDRFECRERLVADLEKEGLLVKTEPYMVKLGRGQRSGAIIEPRISLQWWCDMKAMAQMAADAVRSGRIKIVPERFEKTWFQWLDNIRDWCISRQLWWGHQIPVWYVENAETLTRSQQVGASERDNVQRASLPTQYCALTEADAYRAAIADWGPNVVLRQDEDVLDTWFSSGLWPFSTLGWPRDTDDMRRYYPTTMLETGYDILFFWVARMVMLGLELTGDVPFTTVYLHGLIRTADGKKMSKSRPDKIIDPLELIDTYGTDALRFFLVTAGAPGNDIKMDARKVDGKWRSDRIEGARNFANKLWNAARFVLGKVSETSKVSMVSEVSDNAKTPPTLMTLPTPPTPPPSLPDAWICTRLNRVIARVRAYMDAYEYGEAGRLIYDFIWSDFCDWYLEFSKIKLNPAVLVQMLDAALRLLHPFMPFVTEELWQKLKETAAGRWPLLSFNYPALMLAPYPRPDEVPATGDDAAMAGMALVQEAIHAIRNARAEYNVEQGRRIPALISAGAHVAYFEEMRESIKMLARVDDGLVIAEHVSAPEQAVTLALGSATVYLPLAGLVDFEAERKRLRDELAELEAQIAKSEGLLASDFSRRAPAAVVEKERAKLADLRARRDQVRERLAG